VSTDVIFNAVFPAPKPAALRFAELCDFFSLRLGCSGPYRVKVYELIDSGHAVGKMDWSASDPKHLARVKEFLSKYEAEKYAVVGSWTMRCKRDGHAIQYGVDLTTRSPLTRWVSRFDRDIDVTWDLGNVRRYIEHRDDQPDADQVIADLRALVEFGAASVWGAADSPLNPRELYAMYHRDPNEYRNDGLPEPLANGPIEEAYVEVAAEYARERCDAGGGPRICASVAGPIVYSPKLAWGTLKLFYTYLDEMVKAALR
jgi:hypothetical protein